MDLFEKGWDVGTYIVLILNTLLYKQAELEEGFRESMLKRRIR